MEVDLLGIGRRSHLLLLGGGGGGAVQCGGVIKEKFPDFRSPEVGISVNDAVLMLISTNLHRKAVRFLLKQGHL